MDTSMIVRVVAAIAFVVVLGILIVRRKKKSA
jgi:LPXTG-motif cell wall-anchored protein